MDLEWTLKKYDGRFMDIMDEINQLKAKIRSLSARISRLKTRMEEEGVEEFEEEREEGIPIQTSQEIDWSQIPPGTNLAEFIQDKLRNP